MKFHNLSLATLNIAYTYACKKLHIRGIAGIGGSPLLLVLSNLSDITRCDRTTGQLKQGIVLTNQGFVIGSLRRNRLSLAIDIGFDRGNGNPCIVANGAGSSGRGRSDRNFMVAEYGKIPLIRQGISGK